MAAASKAIFKHLPCCCYHCITTLILLSCSGVSPRDCLSGIFSIGMYPGMWPLTLQFLKTIAFLCNKKNRELKTRKVATGVFGWARLGQAENRSLVEGFQRWDGIHIAFYVSGDRTRTCFAKISSIVFVIILLTIYYLLY